MRKISSHCPNQRQGQQPGDIESCDGKNAPQRHNPGLGTELLEQREKTHRQHKGQKSGNPELLNAVRHDVLLPSGALNPSPKIVPILDLGHTLLGGVFFRESLPAQTFEGLDEMAGKFFDNFGSLARLESKAIELAAHDRLPIRHVPPSSAAALRAP